jgi:hypothetical protein
MKRSSRVSPGREAVPQGSRRGLRSRVAAAFRRFAHGVDARTAIVRTFAFYRSSGKTWARALAA